MSNDAAGPAHSPWDRHKAAYCPTRSGARAIDNDEALEGTDAPGGPRSEGRRQGSGLADEGHEPLDVSGGAIDARCARGRSERSGGPGHQRLRVARVLE